MFQWQKLMQFLFKFWRACLSIRVVTILLKSAKVKSILTGWSAVLQSLTNFCLVCRLVSSSMLYFDPSTRVTGSLEQWGYAVMACMDQSVVWLDRLVWFLSPLVKFLNSAILIIGLSWKRAQMFSKDRPHLGPESLCCRKLVDASSLAANAGFSATPLWGLNASLSEIVPLGPVLVSS